MPTTTTADTLTPGQLFDARGNGYPCEVIHAEPVHISHWYAGIRITYRRLTDGRTFADEMGADARVRVLDLAAALDLMPETMGTR